MSNINLHLPSNAHMTFNAQVRAMFGKRAIVILSSSVRVRYLLLSPNVSKGGKNVASQKIIPTVIASAAVKTQIYC